METAEQVPMAVTTALIEEGKQVRVALAEHPVTKQIAPCVPYKDYADVFTYEEKAIWQMIQRTPWLKKHSTTNVMLAVDGKMRPQLCLFEECALGVFMKLQPKRCKDPNVGARIDELQEKLMMILRDALKGHVRERAGYDWQETERILPRPGLSMEAISSLCRVADKELRGRASLRALHYFTGMPVDDLVEIIERGDEEAALDLSRFLDALSEIDIEDHGIEKETLEGGRIAYEGETHSFFSAFSAIANRLRWKLPAATTKGLGDLLAREAETLAGIGWRRSLARINRGRRYWRYEQTAKH